MSIILHNRFYIFTPAGLQDYSDVLEDDSMTELKLKAK